MTNILKEGINLLVEFFFYFFLVLIYKMFSEKKTTPVNWARISNFIVTNNILDKCKTHHRRRKLQGLDKTSSSPVEVKIESKII